MYIYEQSGNSMAQHRLDDEHRNFFQKINAAAFTNPFDESYCQTKLDLAEIGRTKSEQALNQAILTKLNNRLEAQHKQAKAEQNLDEDDARLLEQARL
ncbi:MAG: hypothetical protein V3V22_02775, partial [Methylococcales bacterium]